MKSIGVRELRQRASTYLRQVEAGEALEITARGRPVALLIPLRGTDVLDRLVRQGRVTRPTGDLLDLGTPPSPAGGVASPGAMIERARADERQLVYLDSSALVKLVIAESESPALRRYLRAQPDRASCALARVEVLRAVRRHGPAAVTRARRLLERLNLVRLD